jgi:hypothetical protein
LKAPEGLCVGEPRGAAGRHYFLTVKTLIVIEYVWRRKDKNHSGRILNVFILDLNYFCELKASVVVAGIQGLVCGRSKLLEIVFQKCHN